MTYTEQSIKLAIENNWKFHGDVPTFDESTGCWYVSDGDGGYNIPTISDFLLDPLFWQAFCKGIETIDPDEWQWCTYEFMAHIMGGHSIEDFFKSLIENK